MKAIIVFALLALGAFAAGDIKEPHMNCLPQLDMAFFDLRGLQSPNNTDFISKFGVLSSNKIAFSLCGTTVTNCSKPTHAALLIPDKPCFSLTGNQMSDVTFKMLNEKNRSAGIQIMLKGGDYDSNFTLKVQCSDKVSVGMYKTSNNKYYEVSMNHPAGCPKLDVKPIMNYISGEEWILKVGLIIIGLLLTFMGRQLVKPALFTLGFGATFVTTTYFIFALFITANTPIWTLWSLLALCVLAGLIVGTAAAYIEWLGFLVVGLALGYCCGSFFFTIIVHFNVPHPDLVNYGVMFVAGIIFFIAMYKFRDALLIAATALFGSLMVSRTFMATVASLPTEFEILDMFNNGVTIPATVWGYLALYVVLAGLGIWVQKSRKSPDWESKEALVQQGNPYSYYHRA